MENNMKTENARIQNIGLYYEGHFGNVYVKCVLDGRGWGAQIIIPMEKITAKMEHPNCLSWDSGLSFPT